MKPYYYVYRIGGSRGPVVKHPTVEAAVAESHRLAGQHPGEAFEILKCLAVTRTTEPATFWNDGEGPSAPDNGFRYFVNGYAAWRVSPEGLVQIATCHDPTWGPSICNPEDLVEDGLVAVPASQLPHPIKP